MTIEPRREGEHQHESLPAESRSNMDSLKNIVCDLIENRLRRGNGSTLVTAPRLTREVKRVIKGTELYSQLVGKNAKRLNTDVDHILRDYPGSQLWDSISGKRGLSGSVYMIHSDSLPGEACTPYLSSSQRVKEFLQSWKAPVITPGEISKLLDMSESNVRNALHELFSERWIARVKTGLYCLPGREDAAQEYLDTIRNPVNVEMPKEILQDYNPILQALRERSPMTPLQIAKRAKLAKSPIVRELQRMVKSGEVIRISYGFYCLSDQVKDIELQERESFGSLRDRQTVTIAEAIFPVIAASISSKNMTVSELACVTGLTSHVLRSTVERLVNGGILERDDLGLVRIVPQETPECLALLHLIAQCTCWREVIRVLICRYMKGHQVSSGRDFQRLFRIRSFVRTQLVFLEAIEDQMPFNEAVDALCIEGILERLDSDFYRFHQFS